MKKILTALLIMLMLAVPVSAHSDENLRDFQIVWNRPLLFCNTEGRSRRFEDRDPFIVKGRKASSEEIEFFKKKALERSKVENEERFKKGVDASREEPVQWLDKQNGERILDYLIVYIDGKKYFVKNVVDESHDTVGRYRILDLTKYPKNELVDKKRENAGKVTNTMPGYDDAKSVLRGSYYISPYIKEKANSFEFPETLSLSDQLALATYQYASLGIKYDHSGSASNQFHTLDNRYGMCHSMSVVFKMFLEKTNVPHRMIYQKFATYVPGRSAHALLAVKVGDEWQYLDPVRIESAVNRIEASSLTDAKSQQEKIEIGNNILKTFLGAHGVLEEEIPDKIRLFDLKEKEPERIWEYWGDTFVRDKVIDNSWDRIIVGF